MFTNKNPVGAQEFAMLVQKICASQLAKYEDYSQMLQLLGQDLLSPRMVTTKSKHSFIWRGILKGWEICSKGITWSPHYQTNMNTLHTKWIPNIKSFRNSIEDPFSINDHSLKIRDIYNNHKWDFTKFSINIPNNIKESISNVRICTKGSTCDNPIWSLTIKGFFTTKSCYGLINPPLNNQSESK